MDIKLLLLKSIALLYYFSRVESTDDGPVKESITKILAKIEIPDDPLNKSKERYTLLELRNILVWLHRQNLKNKIDLTELMTRIQIACDQDIKTLKMYETNIIETETMDEATRRYNGAYSDILDYLAGEDLVDLLRNASMKVSFNKSTIEDLNTFKAQIIDGLNGIRIGATEASDDASVIDLSDLDKMDEVFRKADMLASDKGILSYGFKAMNRMTGDQGGGRRGEYNAVVALAGHNKTGNLLDHFISFCLFNEPQLVDPTKKPLHVYFTIEDPITEVMRKLYVLLKQHETGLPVQLRGMDYKEMSRYVSEVLTSRGFHVKIVDFENGGSPYLYLNRLQSFIDQGYEIVSCISDYVHLMDSNVVGKTNQSDNTKGIHRIISDWTKPRDILHWTAHQLSADARDLMRMFPEDFISRLIDKGYYEGCKTLSTEFDFEYATCKRISGGFTWQEFQWAKHRKLGATDEKDKYFTMKYYPIGMIGYPYDVHVDQDLSYKKVGNRATQGGDKSEWSDFGDGDL